MALGPVEPTAAGTPIPRPGTYAGSGAMVGDPQYGVELGFTIDAGTVKPVARVFTMPGCSGGFFLPDMALDGNQFEGTYSAPPETNRIEAHFVTATRIKGKVTLERPDAASCGDPGTYVYKFKARRYGKP